MSYEDLSPKQQEILEYLKQSTLQKGYPPSVREICEVVHLKSTSSVHAHLETLERCGYIRRDPTKPRAIEIVDEDFNILRREMVQVPVIGTVAAGTPLFAEENIEEYFPLPADRLPNNQMFMLHVKGCSMQEMGILNDDLVLCEKTATASNGEVVVALLNDSATVKRFYKEDGHFRLQPENSSMSPIIVDQVTVLGKVVGLYRNHIV